MVHTRSRLQTAQHKARKEPGRAKEKEDLLKATLTKLEAPISYHSPGSSRRSLGIYPAVPSVRTSLRAWHRCGAEECARANVGLGLPVKTVRAGRIISLHTSRARKGA